MCVRVCARVCVRALCRNPEGSTQVGDMRDILSQVSDIVRLKLLLEVKAANKVGCAIKGHSARRMANRLSRLREEEGLTAASLLMMALRAFFAAGVVNVIQRGHGFNMPNPALCFLCEAATWGRKWLVVAFCGGRLY